MGPVTELAVVANGSTRMGRAGDEGEDEQEILKALSLGDWEEWRKGKEGLNRQSHVSKTSGRR